MGATMPRGLLVLPLFPLSMGVAFCCSLGGSAGGLQDGIGAAGELVAGEAARTDDGIGRPLGLPPLGRCTAAAAEGRCADDGVGSRDALPPLLTASAEGFTGTQEVRATIGFGAGSREVDAGRGDIVGGGGGGWGGGTVGR